MKEETPELFRKVYIKSESDLPKEGKYFCHIPGAGDILFMGDMKLINSDNKKIIDYYLEPIEPEPAKTEKEIIEQGEKEERKQIVKSVLDVWDKAESNISRFKSERFESLRERFYSEFTLDEIGDIMSYFDNMKVDNPEQSERKTAEEWFDINGSNYKGIKSRHNAIQMLSDYRSQGMPEITDEEIEKGAEQYMYNIGTVRYVKEAQHDWIEGAKWYRSRLKR